MTNRMINLYQSKLPPDAFQAIKPQLEAWQADMLQKYPSGPPRTVGSGGGGMTDAQASAALDDLLKTI
jgi:hypothetical protein